MGQVSYGYSATSVLTTYRSCAIRFDILAHEGRLRRRSCRRSGEVASPGCGANRNAGGQGSLRQPLWLADKSLTAPVFHSRRRRRRSPAENRHGGAPREVPFATGQAAPQGSEVAPRTRDKSKECACRRSIHPSFGVAVRTRYQKEGTTRTQGCGAGTRKDTASEETDA